MNAKYSITNLKLVFIMMLRDYWDKNGKEMGPIRAFFNFWFLEVPALITERYSLLRFDYLVAGNDLFAALVISIVLSKKGKKVLFHNCMPDDYDYNLILKESQRLIKHEDIAVIEEIIDHPIGECDSFDALLRKLGQILSTTNKIEKQAFVAQNIKLINSSATNTLQHWYPNLCWTEFKTDSLKTKKYGFSPFNICKKQNKWYKNYQCALSFKDAIILTKLNQSLSADFFAKPINFAYMGGKLSSNLVYTSENRIVDIKLLLEAIEKRG